MTKSKKFAALIPLYIGILMAFSLSAHAQEETDDEEHGLYIEKPRVFSGGIVAGVNLCQVDGDYYAGYHKFGLNAGGVVYARLTRFVSLSMEILYTQKGSNGPSPQFSPGAANLEILKYSIKNNYVEVPIMINYFDRRKSHFGLGFAYSFLVSSTEPMTTDSFSTIKSFDLSAAYPFKKTDLDIVAGATLHLTKGLYLGVRFQYSLTPIRSGKDLPPMQYARSEQYDNLWVVRLMYLLGK